MNIQFCHLCCSSSVIFRSNPSQFTTISFCQFRFPPIVSCGSRTTVWAHLLYLISWPVRVAVL
jgi:hypothetical protein